ncbi:MAG: hypothetical protein EAX96_02075 [Candidatus Lokiarchaeota archaeon]|nr:hypothetical protein [Candidatus Lokiarchaeota archaeon]
MSSLRILAFSDFHAYLQQVKYFKLVKQCLIQHKPDVLIFCGDFVVNSSLRQIEFLFKKLEFDNIFYVWGNSDGYEPNFQLKNSNNLHLNPIKLNDFLFVGIGGDEIDCKHQIENLEKKVSNSKEKIILVSHVPPKGACDLCNDGRNVGVVELREFINLIQPKLHIFGHIHEQARSESIINLTTCINVGAEGMLITIKNGKIEIFFI